LRGGLQLDADLEADDQLPALVQQLLGSPVLHPPVLGCLVPGHRIAHRRPSGIATARSPRGSSANPAETSNARATRYITSSRSSGAMICSPTGSRPSPE